MVPYTSQPILTSPTHLRLTRNSSKLFSFSHMQISVRPPANGLLVLKRFTAPKNTMLLAFCIEICQMQFWTQPYSQVISNPPCSNTSESSSSLWCSCYICRSSTKSNQQVASQKWNSMHLCLLRHALRFRGATILRVWFYKSRLAYNYLCFNVSTLRWNYVSHNMVIGCNRNEVAASLSRRYTI